MTQRTTKRAVLTSALSLLLCCTMLIGTTWAWFTDSVTSSGNIIKSGTLNVEMKWAEGDEDPTNTTTWTDASTGAIFNNELWEPGYVDVKHVKIANVGTLALKYQIVIKANGELEENANGHTLADAIDVYYVDPATQVADRATFNAFAAGQTPIKLSDFLTNNADPANNTAQGVLYPEGKGKDSDIVTIALKMREDAGNEYQNMSIGTDFSVQLLATQWTYEEDTFDERYDEFADETPDNVGWPASTSTVTITDPAQPTTISVGSGEGAATVTIPAGGATAGQTFALTVTEVPVDPATTPGETTYDITFTKDGEEVEGGDTVYTVTLNIGFVDLTEFNHNGVAMTKVDSLADLAEGKYYYDEDEGIVTFMTKGFSPFTAKYLFSGGNGKEAHPYLIKTYADWKSLSEKSVSASGVATQGRYFDVLTDLDFTDKTSGKETLEHFSGDLDFNGHSVKGITCENSYTVSSVYGGLIYMTGDATISNLDYYVTSPKTDVTNKIVLWASQNKNLTFKNVNTFGLANLSDNNTGIYLYMANDAAAVKFYGCTNNATLVNSNAFTGVFVGRGDKCKSYVFENCVNNGNISSLPSTQNTGVLISNLNNYGASVTITIVNCVNRGNIYYTAGTTDLVAGNYNPANVTITGELTNEGNVSQVAYTALTVSDDKFVTSAITGAKEYQLGFAFSDAENVYGGTVSLSCQPTQEELANNAIFAYSWIGEKDLPDGAVTGTVTIGGTEFKTYDDNGTMYYVFNRNNGESRAFKTQPIVTLTAIGEDNSVSLYTYKYVDNIEIVNIEIV